MGMNKDLEFDKSYCMILHQCMDRGDIGSSSMTFFVDMNMSEFAMKSCGNGEAITTDVSHNYFNEFDLPNLFDLEAAIAELSDGDVENGDDGDE
jgi:hypothetical protein